jgi:hypothetical protein
MLRHADYNPALAQDTPSTVTWATGTTKTVTDANVKATSKILVIPTSVPAGRWAITTIAAGSFIVESSDAENNATFIYEIH